MEGIGGRRCVKEVAEVSRGLIMESFVGKEKFFLVNGIVRGAIQVQ